MKEIDIIKIIDKSHSIFIDFTGFGTAYKEGDKLVFVWKDNEGDEYKQEIDKDELKTISWNEELKSIYFTLKDKTRFYVTLLIPYNPLYISYK